MQVEEKYAENSGVNEKVGHSVQSALNPKNIPNSGTTMTGPASNQYRAHQF